MLTINLSTDIEQPQGEVVGFVKRAGKNNSVKMLKQYELKFDGKGGLPPRRLMMLSIPIAKQ